MASNADGNLPDVQTLIKEIKNKKGDVVSAKSLFQEGKYVGLYFSAHWCPPCRSFTPKLKDFYNNNKDAINLEIIFVSSDRDSASFKGYYDDMPWCVLPYDNEDSKKSKDELTKVFNVGGIPTLLLFNGADGKLITKDARGGVMEDPEAKNFPWLPLTVPQMLNVNVLARKNGPDSKPETIPCEEAIAGKVVGIYFSAHWCPPCRQFTPQLVTTYKNLKEQKKNFEVIFVTSDRSEEAFEEYFAEMPWMALPYSDTKGRKALSDHFEVQGIPALIILDEEKNVITKYGRGAVSQDPEGKKFPWKQDALAPLNGMTTTCINQTPTLIYMTDGNEQEVAKAKEILQDIAEKYQADVETAKKAKQKVKELVFLYEGVTGESTELADSIRGFLRLETDPQVVLMDIQAGKKCVVTKLTREDIEEVVEKYKNDMLDFCPLQEAV